MRVVYVVGMPGVGKTTAVSLAIDLLAWNELGVVETPFAHITYDSGAIQLGRHRPPFGGTDALSMSVGPAACEFVASHPAPLVIGEGDRLAYDGFLRACADAGDLELVLLDCLPAVARDRAHGRGSEQSERWVRSRISKVDSLTARWPHIRIDASQSSIGVALQLSRVLAGAGPPGDPRSAS